MRTIQSGFTLIELMIVLTIIAILAVIGIPIYNESTIRARAAEGFALAGPAKLAVAENASAGAQTLSGGWTFNSKTENVDNIAIDNASGKITITLSPVAGDGTIDLTPTAGGAALQAGSVPAAAIAWSCKGGTLKAAYRPAICR